MPILREWLDDMPQQFQGKARIQILVAAFAKQLDELNKVFEEINSKTTLETAVGQNLDYVGNIATMTRKDAHMILRKGYQAEITDDIYRKVILWKLIKNTCDCTYEDIMGSMSLLWNTDNIQYIEDPERPATILIKMPTLQIDDVDPIVGRILSIKPGGVGLVYALGYIIEENISGLEHVDVSRVVMRTSLLFWGMKILNGKWLLDGTNTLSAVRQKIGGKTVLRTKISDIVESISDAEVFFRKNYWCLGGQQTLDGSRQLNAEISKEVL